jgi:transcriptional regulator with XRE-family HTH domain
MTEISVTSQAEIPFVPLAGISCDLLHMSDAAEILRVRLAEAIDRKGITARTLSGLINANHSYVSQLLSGKGGVPSASRIAALARELDVSVDWLTGDSNQREPIRSEVTVLDGPVSWRGPAPDLPPVPLVGTGDCATISFEDQSGNMLEIERCSFDADHTVRMIARPPALAGARDVYAIYFHGESMLPRFEPGDVGFVDPRRPAGPGDYVLVQLNSGQDDDVVSVLVKRLVRATAKELILEQFNPPATFTVPRARVARYHRILRQAELFL